MRRRIASRLRCWADRLDDRGATKVTGMTITMEQGHGFVLHQNTRGSHGGMRVCYVGDDEYDKAYTEADNPPQRIDWRTLTLHDPRKPLPR